MFESESARHEGLDYFLATVDIGVTHFSACDVREGWSVTFDACKTASLHYCLAGSGALVMQSVPPITMTPHTFVLLPPGAAYRIESATASPAKQDYRPRLCVSPSRESVPIVTVGQGDPGISTACGELTLGIAARSDPFALINQPLVAHFGGSEGLRDQFVMLLAESARPGVGSRVLTEALLKQCLILALRRRIEIGDSMLPWLGGIADARLGRALHAIFKQPDSPFTVEHLATIAGMSRSAFAAGFCRAFGQSPISLLKMVRLRRAGELLATTTLSVTEVARRVGFSSRSQFSKAFSDFHGVDPTRFRRTASLTR